MMALDVLFLVHRIPFPLNKGERIRAFHELRALCRRGHRVHLMTFVDESSHATDVEHLRTICASVTAIRARRTSRLLHTARCLTTREPLSLGYFRSAAMKSAVDQALDARHIDVIVAFSSTMAQYVPREWEQHTIVDLVDADSEKFRAYADAGGLLSKWLYQREATLLSRYETFIAESGSHCLFVSERESALVPGTARRSVLSCAVDTEFLERPPDFVRSAHDSPPTAVFTGSMDYRPNIDGVDFFVRDVMPVIRKRLPSFTFHIVGRAPTQRVKALASCPQVKVTGEVPDVRPYLWAADVCVVPLRIARGVQNKLLEAMAAGCPVVGTSEALAGLDVVPERECLVADSICDFADCVVRVMTDQALARRLSVSARSYVERAHHLDVITPGFVNAVEAAGYAYRDHQRRRVL